MPNPERENISSIVQNGLCTSCGICRGACPKGSISFEYGSERNVPQVDHQTCIDCGLCLQACPGKGAMLHADGETLFGTQEDIHYNRICGQWLGAYIGHSADYDIQYHSSSGGLVSTFLIYLLEQKIIDGAVVVGYKKENPFEPVPFIATSKEEILSSRGSKYIIVSFDKVVSDILAFQGKLVVVGLPCQIQGLRNLARQSRHLREHVVGYFSIYCSLNKTKHSLDYYLRKYNVRKDQVGYFSFRDDGCLGHMKFVSKDNKKTKKIPYLSYWFGTHSFFLNKRCLLCADHFGELADISFGDINIEPYNQEKVGISSVVTRSKFWDTCLNACSVSKYITLDPCSVEDICRSQMYAQSHKKGPGIQAYFGLRKLLGLKNPQYDLAFEQPPTCKDYLGALVKYLMMWIGSCRSLWFLIDKLDKSDRQIIEN